MSLAVTKEAARGRRGLFRLSRPKHKVPVYAARTIAPHLARCENEFDARKILGVRRSTSDLPAGFGLRAVFGCPSRTGQ